MCDIDRAVEVATQQDFLAFTEGHPYPTDYEPEPDPVPYYPLDWVFATVEAMRKRDAIIAERDAVLGVLADVVAECAEVGQ